jgi:hypothetical protein
MRVNCTAAIISRAARFVDSSVKRQFIALCSAMSVEIHLPVQNFGSVLGAGKGGVQNPKVAVGEF